MAGKPPQRRPLGRLIPVVIAAAIAVFGLVQVGWWLAGRLPAWQDARRLERAGADLRSTDAQARGLAIRTLGFAQPRSLPYLVVAAGDPDPDLRMRALQAIGTPMTIDPGAVPTLIAKLDDPVPAVRSLAVLLVARAGPAARGAVGRLGALTRDDDPYFRLEAARALRRVAPAAEATYRTVFLARLTDPDPARDPDRTTFAAELAEIGPEARAEAIAALRAMLADSARRETRRQAIQCLGRIGPPARAAAPALAAALGDDDLVARCYAVAALAAIEGGDAGRTKDTLADLADRELLPADMALPVTKLLELGLTDGSDIPLAREFLDQAAEEYRRLEVEAQRAQAQPADPAAP